MQDSCRTRAGVQHRSVYPLVCVSPGLCIPWPVYPLACVSPGLCIPCVPAPGALGQATQATLNLAGKYDTIPNYDIGKIHREQRRSGGALLAPQACRPSLILACASDCRPSLILNPKLIIIGHAFWHQHRSGFDLLDRSELLMSSWSGPCMDGFNWFISFRTTSRTKKAPEQCQLMQL